MTGEEGTGSCVTCRKRDPRRGYVCEVERSKLRTYLSEIPDLFEQLLAEPLSPSGSPGKGGPVSGSRERPLPIRVDLFDLTHAGAGEYLTGEDQVGYVPVWMTLQTWAADWMQVLDRGERGPEWWVGGFCSWMLERVDDICDIHPAVDEAFGDIRQLHGTLRAQLGMTDPRPEHLVGVPCKRCGQGTLWRVPASEYAAECAIPDCRSVLKADEYEAWTRELAERLRRKGIRRSDKPAA